MQRELPLLYAWQDPLSHILCLVKLVGKGWGIQLEPRLHPLQLLVRLFAQRTEDRFAPREREIQGKKFGPLLETGCPEVQARILRFTGELLTSQAHP